MAQKLKRWAARSGVGVWFLVLFWFLPPFAHQVKHLCPIKPDGLPEAQAIPAFARKYGFNCEICHSPSFPKLNDYGNRFRDKGFQTDTDKDMPVMDAPVGYWPIALRTTVGYNSSHLEQSTQKITSGSFGFTGLDILSFGLLAPDVSFGVVYTPGLNSSGFNAQPSSTDSDLEAAFVQLSDLQRFLGLGERKYWLNLKLGKFEPDIPFSEHRSPTLNTPYVIYHYQSGMPYTTFLTGLNTQSYANPDDFALGENQSGAQLSGIKDTAFAGTFRYAFSALSNSNLNQDGSGGGHSTNFYGHITQSIKGYGFASGDRVGVFGAAGNVPTKHNDAAPTQNGVGEGEQPFSRIGADLSLTYHNFVNLFGAWMRARDSQGMFASQNIATAQKAIWNGGFVEVDVIPVRKKQTKSPNLLIGYRYDAVRNVQQGDSTFDKKFNDVDSHTLFARYYFLVTDRGAAALHLEYNQFRDKKVAADGGDQKGRTTLTGIDFAF